MTVETLVPECKISIEIIVHQKCICCCCTVYCIFRLSLKITHKGKVLHLIFSQSANPGNNFNVDPLNQSLSKVGLLLSLVSASFSIWSVAAVLVPLWASSEQYKTPPLSSVSTPAPSWRGLAHQDPFTVSIPTRNSTFAGQSTVQRSKEFGAGQSKTGQESQTFTGFWKISPLFCTFCKNGFSWTDQKISVKSWILNFFRWTSIFDKINGKLGYLTGVWMFEN